MSGPAARRRVLGVPTLEDLPDPRGKRVLVRASLDLPLGVEEHTAMARLRAESLTSTLHWLAEGGAEATVCGDAGGAGPDEETQRFGRVRRIVRALAPGAEVADDSSGGGVSTENPEIVSRLVSSHDLFVNDSFQWSHLPLPSLIVPPSRLASAVGRTLQRDLEALAPILDRPGRPFVAILGGDRPESRLRGVEGLVLRADVVLVGGALAVPFLQARGKHPVVDWPEGFLSECRRVYGLAERVYHHVQLPVDLVWLTEDGRVEVAPAGKCPGGMVVDIGPETRQRYGETTEGAGTLLWSGALGYVEDARFAEGSRVVASARGSSDFVVGGDALVDLLDREGRLRSTVSVISATDPALELLKLGDLPALMALRSAVHGQDR